MSTDKTPRPVILGRYAGFFSRAAAYALDRAITYGIAFLIILVVDYILAFLGIERRLASASDSERLNAALTILLSSLGIHFLVSVSYNIGFWLLSGQTPGKRVLGLRVMRADGTRLRLGNALRRQVGYWISAIFYLGFLWILFDDKRRGFHDKIAGTIVTYSWPEGRLRGTFVIERVQRLTERD